MLPFLRSQKLYVLKPGVDPRAAVHPEQFHAGRQQPAEGRGDEPAKPDAEAWEELPRADLLDGSFNDRNLHRVALTTDAGLGKSYNLVWLRHELNEKGRRVRAFLLPIGKLKSAADLIRDLLVPQVRDTPGNNREDPDHLRVDLERLRDRGQLVLLCDGLDMANDESVQALIGLLEPKGEWARCRIVVAGRPFALEQHWDRLFDRKPWQFVQIAEFDSKQQRAALGKLDGRDRYDRIPREARNILTIPRVLEYLQPLEAEQLGALKTVADVYWQACDYMLSRALGGKVDILTSEHYLAVLGALAFTMYARTERQDAETNDLQPNLDRIPAKEMSGFLKEVKRRLESVGECDSRKEFVADLEELSRMNAVLNHGWLDVRRVGGGREDLVWRNASLQEFFAAYWVTRWGDEADTQLLADWVVDPLTDGNRGFYWFWRYASEMPDDAILPSTRQPPTSWQDAMAPLYDGSVRDSEGHPIRSTEFIYRSWDRMERWNAGPLQTFLKGFQDICAEEKGAEKKEIAEKMLWYLGPKGEPLPAFIPLVGSGKPGDGGTFILGDNQDDRDATVTLSPFWMHRFCVTNLEYELFDPRHRDRRWWQAKPHPSGTDDRCPVVNVSWYDAWCFARWVGLVKDGALQIVLPTEAQWEYACRAGQRTPFTFHEGHDGQSCTPDVCNFDGNYPFPEGATMARADGVEVYRERTLPVDGLPPNRWGLYQMHGNVWEWCEDRRSPAASARVLRGGCWIYDGGYCRSANRDWGGPVNRFRFIGFRLAAVPCIVGAKSGQQEGGAQAT